MIAIFKTVNWKNVIKDVVKFYAYFLILYVLAFGLVWTYTHFTLEPFLDSEELLKGKQDLRDYNETLELISELTGTYMFVLVCFGVFFSIPPKSFKHVTLVSILISLTANMPIFYDAFQEWLRDNLHLFGHIFLAWFSAHAWERLRKLKA